MRLVTGIGPEGGIAVRADRIIAITEVKAQGVHGTTILCKVWTDTKGGDNYNFCDSYRDILRKWLDALGAHTEI